MVAEPRKLEDNLAKRSLVILIPGIGGSVLRTADSRIAWDGSYGNVLSVRGNSERMADVSRELRPGGVVGTPFRIFGWAPFRGYHRLIDELGTLFAAAEVDYGDPATPNLAARVVAFPYDFRQSCSDNAECLDHLVESRLDKLGLSDHKSVVLVAHSMGGIIGRTWLAQSEKWELCRHVFTLGSPLNGAPKALELLVNGPTWMTGAKHRLQRMLQGWPSMYDLLPKYPTVMKATDQDSSTYHGKLSARDILATLAPGLGEDAEKASSCHFQVNEQWRTNAHAVGATYLVGRGRKTYQWATWDGKQFRSQKTLCEWWNPAGVRDSGDGTVPEVAAIPQEHQHDRIEKDLSWVKHTSMPDAAEVLDELVVALTGMPGENMSDWWEGERARRSVVRGEAPAIEVDIEDAYSFAPGANEPRPMVGVEFRDQEPAQPRFRLYRGDVEVASGFFERSNGRREAPLPLAAPGEYRIKIAASADYSDGQRTAEASFDVFRPVEE